MTNYASSDAYNFIMETIYIDRLFILNLIIDYLILLVSAKVCGVLLRRWRYFFAAVSGAVYAALSVIPALSFLSLTPLKLAAGIIMAVIAFGKEDRIFRCAVVFFAVSALFGGAIWAISVQSGTYSSDFVYIPISMPVLALSFALIYAALSLIFKRTVYNAQRCVSEVLIEFMGRSVTLRALSDSGNSLYDPITNSSILICGADTLAPIFREYTDILKGLDCADILTVPEFSGRLRLIPYSAVGTASGLLPAFRPDKIIVGGKVRDDIAVAVSPTEICGDGFDCII